MSATNKSGVGRGKPTVRAGHNPNGDQSIDDDPTQRPEQITGFTIQDMVQGNNTGTKHASVYQMIV